MYSQITLLIGVGLSLIALLWTAKRRGPPLPPGPKPWPLIGNALQIDFDYQYKTYGKQWQKQYGDIVSISVFGKRIVVLNTLQAVQELVEKGGAKHASRPQSVLFEMMGFSPILPLLPYGDEWRRHRRWAQAAVGDRTSFEKLRSILLNQIVVALSKIMERPDAFESVIKHYSGGTMSQIVYGRTTSASDDSFVELADRAITGLTAAGSPSAAMVDFFPLLRYVPVWVPGFGWKQTALEVRKLILKSMTIPFERTKQAMLNGTAQKSFLATLLEEKMDRTGHLTPEDERSLKGASSVLYAGGTDTTASAIVTFILAMLLHPDVCKKAQAEVEHVVGDTRLPDFNDMESLPYVEAVVREVYRWNPPLPIGIPYQAMSDDEYRGYYIPRQSVIIANMWQIMHDPDTFGPDPEAFRPERYAEMDLSTLEAKDPRKFVFGFGRRVCPGRQLGDGSVWLAVACMLATLTFDKARDSDGNEIIPAAGFMPGAVSHPKPFSCNIRARTQKAAELVSALEGSLSG